MNRVLIIGFGTLGRALAGAAWLKRHRIEAVSRSPVGDAPVPVSPLDVTREGEVRRFFSEKGPWALVVNCAAMTDVDACEENAEAAYAANALAVKFLATAASRTGAAFVHLSTNYVFPGTEEKERGEDDAVGPLSVYGLTKLAGEYHALAPAGVSAVIRTSWIFGGRKRDFVRHFLEKFSRPDRIPVVADQRAALTYAPDLAEAIGPVVERELWPARAEGRKLTRVYHLTNAGACTRYEMLLRMRDLLGRTNEIEQVEGAAFPAWKAVRPKTSVLSNARYEAAFGVRLRHWHEALAEHLGKERASCAS